ncbi:MAG TPA: hypothetical protein VF167_14475 [Longimicrobiaceae bacterium]
MRVATLLLLWLTLSVPASAQQEEANLHWNELSVQAHLDAEGRLHLREVQAIEFDGAWNGGQRRFDIRRGQKLVLDGITRVDRASGERFELVEVDDEPAEIDQFEWSDKEIVRWRSRLETDPPFDNQELVYELRYVLWPVLMRAEDGGYRLAHDFAFPDRNGVIERFQVDLTLDPAWESPFGSHIRETASDLPPDRGYSLVVPLRNTAADAPLAAPPPAPAWTRTAVIAGALLIPLLVLLALLRRGRDLARAAPLTPPEEIDAEWLERHIFVHPPEIVGTAWDRAVSEAEVAALLARLVEEGKLSSRVEPDEKGEPVLHLRRIAPLDAFAPHERDLLEALFVDDSEETSTTAVREHYQDKGFDPAAKIRKALEERLEGLPGPGRVPRRVLGGAGLFLAGIALTLVVPDRPGRWPVVVVCLAAAVLSAALATLLAGQLARRVTHRGGVMVGTVLALGAPAALLVLLANGPLAREEVAAFYRPGAGLLLALLVVLAGVGMLASAFAQPTETVERLGFRRRLVSARRFFLAELERPEPRLRDAWFPYLLAFGLGEQVDRWVRAFGKEGGKGTTAALAGAAGAASGGRPASSSSGWTGGGPQFGGGSFAGGGAGGGWGVAAAGMAAGVSAPGSTGGGGTGVSVSGGGGGGGW